MKTFNDFYDKRLKEIKKCSKRDKVSVKDFIKINYHKTVSEFKKWQKQLYTGKSCHSFWHRECVNKGVECYRCNKYYSLKDWDKMSVKEKNNIKNS